MSEIKLFKVHGQVEELTPTEATMEKELQTLIERNMEAFFGVRFLESEFAITNGRIDSIGIDENNCPVIFEYKRSSSENVINQGLFYLDWLLDHKADFKLLVMEKLGIDAAEGIDWSVPCVVCIASGFTKYDLYAIKQMQRNIKLVRYRRYKEGLLLFEHLNAPSEKPVQAAAGERRGRGDKTHQEKLAAAPEKIKNLYTTVCNYIESLGDDITASQLKLYLAYKKVKNIICIEVFNSHVLLTLKLDPTTVVLEEGFTRDVRNIGHWGTGGLQVILRSPEDFERARPLIERSYFEG